MRTTHTGRLSQNTISLRLPVSHLRRSTMTMTFMTLPHELHVPLQCYLRKAHHLRYQRNHLQLNQICHDNHSMS
jgi:hypothetical protein